MHLAFYPLVSHLATAPSTSEQLGGCPDNNHAYFILRLCPAAGLYYLAEMIEEYSVLAKKVITSTLLVSMCYSLSKTLRIYKYHLTVCSTILYTGDDLQTWHGIAKGGINKRNCLCNC